MDQAMSATDYLEQKILDHVLRVTTFTPPAGLYLALHNTDPTETGTVGEATGGGYARQAITFGASVIDATFGTRGASTNIQSFTNMPAGTWTHFSIKDAVSAGNSLLTGPLTITRTTVAGDPLVIGVGGIIATAD
jgi:hypothetical protein